MIEANNPRISANELVQKVRSEVARHQGASPSVVLNSSVIVPRNTVNFIHIEALLKDAEDRSHPRTKWPDGLNRFPFNISKRLQKFAFKLLEFLTRDQRVVNLSLISAFKESLELNKHLLERVGSLEAQVNGLDAHITTVTGQMQGLGAHVTTVNGQMQVLDAHITAMNQRLQGLDAHITAVDGQLQTLSSNQEQYLLDAFYVALEDKFRGSRESIIERLEVYLPLIVEAKVGTPDAPILDVGCGRGEWLELMRQSGYLARGLDINNVMVKQCHDRGLEVIEVDVLSYLQSLPDASLGAVTGFHIIEHLPLTALLKLFEETVRVLKSGGLAIFETPNPQNVITSTYDFYYDPTHSNPLPSPLTSFIAESSGFHNIKVMDLNPFADTFKVQGEDSQITERFNKYFYGARDYAVIGIKP